MLLILVFLTVCKVNTVSHNETTKTAGAKLSAIANKHFVSMLFKLTQTKKENQIYFGSLFQKFELYFVNTIL
jgi:hypothetical protein